MSLCLQEIHKHIGGVMHGDNIELTSFSIDTRTLTTGACYIAIKGAHFDGNDFIDLAIQAGAKAGIVQRQLAINLPHIVVDNTRVALTKLARAWRQQCAATIIAVTGSNGKTTVKEMIVSILATTTQALATHGNLNNDIGVPLTLLKLQPEHQFGVIEMGTNHPTEITDLCRCALPNIGVITNAGSAHIEGFGSIEGVAKAKGEIYSALAVDGVSIINFDDPYYNYWQTLIGDRQQLSFGLNNGADVTAEAIAYQVEDGQFITEFSLNYQDKTIPVRTQLAGQHNVVNALAAAAVGLVVGLSLNQIKQGLENVRAVPGRMQILPSKYGGLVINDSYNANPASLKAALEVLTTLEGELWLALGAFGELGSESKLIHSQMGEMIKSVGVVRLAAIGSDAESTVQAFGKGAIFFASQEALIKSLRQQLTDKQVLLIKGSRVQHMEQVTLALTKAEVA